MDAYEVARIKILHRPDMHWRNGEVFAGCSCGTPYHPCDVLLAALEAERQANAPARDRDRDRDRR